ncbi:MAG TPA: hypothetical protein ENK11_00620 [Phycisphaerales bacterium]|nr:hypothetical protein [Phycisphaerales bacterium]
MVQTVKVLSGWLRAALVAALLAAFPMAMTGPVLFAGPVWASFEPAEDGQALDQIILRNGKVIEGRILHESADEVEMEVIVGTLRASTTYPKADILKIIRAGNTPEADESAGPRSDTDNERADDADEGDDTPMLSASTDAPSVYLIKLEGKFGRDISPTPVRQAVEAARKAQPDFLIVYLNNDWSTLGGELPSDVQGNFDLFMVAEKIIPIFMNEIDLTFEKQPTLVFWVRNAMGGAAFLPFVADEIYMHPEGRIGGIGTLEQLFEGTGDEVVRQKQRSLRLGMAQGVAIAGGYDYRLITAMARKSYVACYDNRGNIYERMPENPGEIVLTDDGEGDNADTMQQLITGEGDDVLTITPEVGLKLGVSRGTAADLDELLDHLGILRNHIMLKGRSTEIVENWKKSVTRAERKIPRLWREYNEVQVGGTPREQRQALGRQISILQEIQGLYRKYGEAFNPFSEGVPQMNQIDMMIEQLKIQIMLLNT